jgi:hypothetical protein
MSELDDDIARGCLENGESIEARWGSGWWSVPQQRDKEPEVVQCPKCNGNAYFLGKDGIDCENCGLITQEEYLRLSDPKYCEEIDEAFREKISKEVKKIKINNW